MRFIKKKGEVRGKNAALAGLECVFFNDEIRLFYQKINVN